VENVFSILDLFDVHEFLDTKMENELRAQEAAERQRESR
jgi:hypothetical protein